MKSLGRKNNSIKNNLTNGNFEKSFSKEQNANFFHKLLEYLANK